MVKIDTWKKIISIVGIITQTVGYFINSTTLIITGMISSIIGMLFIVLLR